MKTPYHQGATDTFCNEYMDMFYNMCEELQRELPSKIYNILDEINWICDSYEEDEAIRSTDSYCIDENILREKIKNIIKRTDIKI